MRPRPIHLVGVGGAGMSAIARLAAQAGYRVSGTDREDSATLAALRSDGVAATAGHDSGALPADAEAIVVSTAIAPDNPELTAARERGIPVLHRADLLAELASGRRTLAVAGAHGKSTTSAMLALALGGASVCVGAEIPGGGGTGGAWGAGPWFVAEADESDRSLLVLAPEAAILLNVDHDHHATFATLAEVEEVFQRFVAGLPAGGVLVAGPDAGARAAAAAALCPVMCVGEEPSAAVRIAARRPGGMTLALDGRRVEVVLAVPGRHNQDNAACAIALAAWCGVAPEAAAARLAGFGGVGRRFELRGEAAGVRVVDDYAHHPAEIAATLAAAREGHAGRLVAVFQPHLYSRTRALGGELGRALEAADLVVVTDVYAAREPPDPDVSGRDVAAAVRPPARAVFVPGLAEAAELLERELRPGDLVLTIGAGDITNLGQELLGRLQKQTADGGGVDELVRPA
ncbi:MAG TPA: UDP-N-acetylmuramate--L-alanine ligase [Miltoncostaeaceae bacterium]|nr:UDP-N-acetylmuramate--L-alanine ligase [Miltoncostaeaceae bacterium]